MLVAESNGVKTFIIPLYGAGLWGPIWGNIAVKENFSTVVGVTFGHKGETPGLGAEIDTKIFQAQFVDKEVFKDIDDFWGAHWSARAGWGRSPEETTHRQAINAINR